MPEKLTRLDIDGFKRVISKIVNICKERPIDGDCNGCQLIKTCRLFCTSIPEYFELPNLKHVDTELEGD